MKQCRLLLNKVSVEDGAVQSDPNNHLIIQVRLFLEDMTLPNNHLSKHNPAITARVLAVIAFVLWLVSLTLVGFVVNENQGEVTGLHILAMGWLGPLDGIFAWYANIFILFAVIKLIITDRSVIVSSVLGCVISLDSFRLDRVLTDEGGGSTLVYGYGPGMLLWVAVSLILLVAAGVRIKEKSITSANTDIRLTPLLSSGSGLMGLVSLIAVSSIFAIKDRQVANTSERTMLRAVVFKKGEVCSVEPFIPDGTINMNGTLELVFTGDIKSGAGKYLDLGLPIVKIGNYDYMRQQVGNEYLVVAQESKTSPSATYTIYERYDGAGKASLYSNVENRYIFQHAWRTIRRRRCPELSNRHPLSIAFGLGERPTTDLTGIHDRDVAKSNNSLKVTDGRVIAIGKREMRLTPSNNINCPEGTGVDYLSTKKGIVIYWPFQINQKYYPRGRGELAICNDGTVYLYKASSRKYFESSTNQNKHTMVVILEARSLDDFSKQWDGMFRFDIADSPIQTERARIVKVDKMADETRMTIADIDGNVIEFGIANN